MNHKQEINQNQSKNEHRETTAQNSTITSFDAVSKAVSAGVSKAVSADELAKQISAQINLLPIEYQNILFLKSEGKRSDEIEQALPTEEAERKIKFSKMLLADALQIEVSQITEELLKVACSASLEHIIDEADPSKRAVSYKELALQKRQTKWHAFRNRAAVFAMGVAVGVLPMLWVHSMQEPPRGDLITTNTYQTQNGQKIVIQIEKADNTKSIISIEEDGIKETQLKGACTFVTYGDWK